MILTEKEAATKACVRSPFGTHQDGTPLFPCVGSRCMGWRQESDGKRTAMAGTTILKDDGTMEYLCRQKHNAPSDPGWEPMAPADGHVRGWTRTSTPRGYCGLAHTP